MISKILTVFALLGLQMWGVAGCGRIEVEYDDGGRCGSTTAASVHSDMLMYDAMVEAFAEVFNMDYTEVVNQGKFIGSTGTDTVNGNGNGNANGNSNGKNRKLAELAGELVNTTSMSVGRMDCPPTTRCRDYCCVFCVCRGNGKRMLLEEAIVENARSLNVPMEEISDLVCATIQANLANAKGCLAGATMTRCSWVELES